MGGKRFAAGILGGLLLGLVVVGAAGVSVLGFGGVLGLSPAAGQVNSINSSSPTSTTATLTFSATTTSGAATSYPPTNTSNSTQTLFSVNVPSGQGSSSLSDIARQPLVLNALVFVPILIAILVGILFHEAAARRDLPDPDLSAS
jgi:hypothetical protein